MLAGLIYPQPIFNYGWRGSGGGMGGVGEEG